MAKLASNLYFVIQDLSLIEPVYNFSLDFYIEIYEKSIENAPRQRRETPALSRQWRQTHLANAPPDPGHNPACEPERETAEAAPNCLPAPRRCASTQPSPAPTRRIQLGGNQRQESSQARDRQKPQHKSASRAGQPARPAAVLTPSRRGCLLPCRDSG